MVVLVTVRQASSGPCIDATQIRDHSVEAVSRYAAEKHHPTRAHPGG
jgi:hypothetical protein